MTGLVNTDNFIRLGLLLQSQIPIYHNLTITEIVSTPEFPSLVNSTDGSVEGGEILHSLFVAAFGPNVTAAQAPALVAQLDHSSRAKNFVIPTIVLVILSGTAIFLRLISRYLLSGRLRLEDFSISIAFIFIFAAQVKALIWIGHVGSGSHQWDITLRQFSDNLYLSWVMYLLYIPAVMFFIKAAFLLFYYQLSTDRRFRIACFGVGTLCFLLMWGDLFSHLFGCNWGFYKDPMHQKCADILAIHKAFGSLHIATDIMILLLPMTVVTVSSLPLRTKFALIGFFGLGGVVCVLTLMRVLSLWGYVKALDYAWRMLDTGIWASIEAHCAMILCCLPQLKQLVLYGKSRFVEYILRHNPEAGTRTTPTPTAAKSCRTDSLATANKTDTYLGDIEEGKVGSRVATESQQNNNLSVVQSRSLGSRIASHVASKISNSRMGSKMASKMSSTFTDTQMSTRIDEDSMAMHGLRPPPPPPPPRIRSWLNKMPDTQESHWT